MHKNKLHNFLYYLKVRRNGYIARVSDTFSIIFAYFIAEWFAYNLAVIPDFAYKGAIAFLLIFLPWQWGCFWLTGLYRGVWRFASLPDLVRIIKAVVLGLMVFLMLALLLRSHFLIPRVLPFLYTIFLIAFLAGSRISYRFLKTYTQLGHSAKRVLIIGAGDAGEGLVRDLFRHATKLYKPLVFLDDNPIKLGREVHGVRVLGRTDDLLLVAKNHDIEHVFIAIPSVSTANMRRLVALCEQADLPYSTLPSLKDLKSSQVKIANLRQVSLEDLIGREEVRIDWEQIENHIRGQVILVTGGGGSIGSELCRQIARFAPKEIIVIDHSEHNLYLLEQSLRKLANAFKYQLSLGSILDEVFLTEQFKKYQPGLVFHAAAYKHVPMLENQIGMAIKNNVLGTKIIAKLAIHCQVKQFVLISTDKAVNPTNIMGMTKRAAEIYCQNLNTQQNATKFITVRFGNVMNSAGSVIPLFRSQIEEGGPVTVTHPEITRYFMTIPEASRLILQAASLGKGGEIFVLDMGEPIKVQYLAEQLIMLSGKELGTDIEIVHTGLRPGEKLFEELFYQEEALVPTTHPKVMRANCKVYDWPNFKEKFVQLKEFLEQNEVHQALNILKEIVPEYVG